MGAIYKASLFAVFLIATSLAEQYNDTCYWTSLRAASIQGMLYANGGFWASMGTGDDGSYGGPTISLNYSKPFNAINNTDLSALFDGPIVNGTQIYYGGTMFANDEAFWLYGGEFSTIGPAIRANEILGYQAYSSASGQTFITQNQTVPQTVAATLTDISNYVVAGAGVNVPSESLGFYFSGLVRADRGQIVYNQGAGELPNFLASWIIQINMSDSQTPEGVNLTLPEDVPPRAGAELVWIPVSSKGVLIAIGGLTTLNAPDLGINLTSSVKSVNFMASLPVYDIASKTWFIQNTTGGPPSPRAQFCSIMTNVTDPSSFEIYIFGGTDGTGNSTVSLGDMWVLSVPSFTWTLVYSDGGTHNRDSHVCVRPYPDQMFVIGGENGQPDSNSGCTDGTIDVFNLTNLTWMNKYDPTVYYEYKIPSAVASKISATPTASGMDPTLLALLQQTYSTYIPTYYPYATGTPQNTSTPSTPPSSGSGHHKSNHVGPIIGSVLGALGLFTIILAIWCFRRSKSGKRSRVQSWINKADTSVTTDDTLYEVDGSSKDPARVEVEGGTVHPSISATSPRAEADGAERFEMLAMGPGWPRAEADGAERFEMFAMSPGSPGAPVEMPTPYHFGEHPTYPRSPAAPGKPTLASHGKQPSETGSHDLSAPSPNAKTQGTLAVATDEAPLTAAAGSSSVPSPPASPPSESGIEQRPSHKRNVSSLSNIIPVSPSSPERSPTLNAMERNSGLGYSVSRPNHMRNLSSVSSGLSNQLVSPAEPDADQRLPSPVALRSALATAAEEDRNNNNGNIADAASLSAKQQPMAPMPEDDGLGPAAEPQPLASHEASHQTPEPRFNRNVVPRKKLSGQSAFKEEDVNPSGPA